MQEATFHPCFRVAVGRERWRPAQWGQCTVQFGSGPSHQLCRLTLSPAGPSFRTVSNPSPPGAPFLPRSALFTPRHPPRHPSARRRGERHLKCIPQEEVASQCEARTGSHREAAQQRCDPEQQGHPRNQSGTGIQASSPGRRSSMRLVFLALQVTSQCASSLQAM